jgi:hypothetical protein
MCLDKWIRGIRLSLAFLLAPAMTAAWLSISMDAVLKHLHWEPSDIANITLGMCWFTCGVVLPYLGALFIGLPYILIMSASALLNFWTWMALVTPLSLVHAAIMYWFLCSFHPSHPLAEVVAGLLVPGTIVSGLCFYLLGVWKPLARHAPNRSDSQIDGSMSSAQAEHVDP